MSKRKPPTEPKGRICQSTRQTCEYDAGGSRKCLAIALIKQGKRNNKEFLFHCKKNGVLPVLCQEHCPDYDTDNGIERIATAYEVIGSESSLATLLSGDYIASWHFALSASIPHSATGTGSPLTRKIVSKREEDRLAMVRHAFRNDADAVDMDSPKPPKPSKIAVHGFTTLYPGGVVEDHIG